MPDGIRLHLVAVYLAELGSVIDDQVQQLDELFSSKPHTVEPRFYKVPRDWAIDGSLYRGFVISKTLL